MGLEFIPYSGDLMGLAVNENHRVFKWTNDYGAKVLFSMTRKGKALSVHFSSDKKGLRHLREALNAYFDFCFREFPWCEMLLGNVNIPSIKRLVVNHCGFEVLLERKEKNEYLCIKVRQ